MDGTWIEKYGYLAVLLGALLEGETAFVLAGYAASRGYLDLLPTYLTAVAGGMLADSTYYFIGRYNGRRLIRRFPSLRKPRARAVLLLRRWGRATAFLTRFAYGLRIVLSLSMGAAHMRFRTYLTFNLLGSLCFAAVYLALGYLFGETVGDLIRRVRPYEEWIIGGVVVAGAAIWAAREYKIFHPRPELDIPPAVVERLEEEVMAELSDDPPADARAERSGEEPPADGRGAG
ncbi:MAG TPA: DedA family protein [Longimicrobiaceae bacterium]|jgi:membrane protein DedA with SNARE-associated domain